MLLVLAYALMENISTFVFTLLLKWCLSVKRKTGFLFLYEKTIYGTSWKGNKLSRLSKNGGKRCAGVPVYLGSWKRLDAKRNIIQKAAEPNQTNQSICKEAVQMQGCRLYRLCSCILYCLYIFFANGIVDQKYGIIYKRNYNFNFLLLPFQE